MPSQQTMPEPPAMLQSLAGTDKTGALMSEVSRGLQNHIHAGIQRSLARRETLAQQFEQLAADPRYSNRSDIVTQARSYSAMLRTIPPGEKLPKEFLNDPKTGRIPAYDQLVLQAHSKPAPAAPVALPEPPSTTPADFDQMFPSAAGGSAVEPPAPAAAGGIPGGEHKGPNAISPSPVQPGTAAAMPEPPPSILPDGMEPTAMGPLDAAHLRKQVSGITDTVTLPGVGDVDKAAIPYLRGQEDRKLKLRLKGLDENGDPLPDEQLPGDMRAKMSYMKAHERLFSAQTELADAKTSGDPQRIEIARINANAAMINARAHERNANTNAQAAAGAVDGGNNDLRETVAAPGEDTGIQWADLTDYTGKRRDALKAHYESQGIPALSGKVAESIHDADTARMNQQSIINHIMSKLPTDAGGRLLAGPSNKLSQYLQTDDDLAAFKTFRTAAIQSLRALAGTGLRITQQEIELAVANDIPEITDTVGTAIKKNRIINEMLTNKVQPILKRGKKGGSNKMPAPPAAPGAPKTAAEYLAKP